MTPEQIEEMGMTMALLEADLLQTKKGLEEAQKQFDEMTVNAVGWKEQYIAEWARRSMLERELAEAQQTIARQQDDITRKDDAVEFWIGMAGRLADACEHYADEHWDNGVLAEDALSYYLPAVGRGGNKEGETQP